MKFPTTLIILFVLFCVVEAARRGEVKRGVLDKTAAAKRGGLTDVLDKRILDKKGELRRQEEVDAAEGAVGDVEEGIEDSAAWKRRAYKRQDGEEGVEGVEDEEGEEDEEDGEEYEEAGLKRTVYKRQDGADVEVDADVDAEARALKRQDADEPAQDAEGADEEE